MFRPIHTEHKGKQAQLLCVHWKTWPPIQAFVEDKEANFRASMSDTDYQRFQLWQKICGLRTMQADKCLSCPHVRTVERTPPHPHMLVTLDGTSKIPVHDIPTLSSLPRNRGHLIATSRPDGAMHSKKDAAWVVRDENKK